MLIQIGSTNRFIDCIEATTPEEQAMGLRGASALPPNAQGIPTGMLFVYDEEAPRRFFMPPDMRFPLDIVFIGENGKVTAVYDRCEPGEAAQFEGKAQWVLEIPSDLATAYEINLGTQIHFDDEEESEGLV